MKHYRPQLRKARIEIIPMIDTIFFLLVFFMFAVLSMSRMRAMPVALPAHQAPGAGHGPEGARVILTMTSGSEYYLGKRSVGKGTAVLQAALTRRLRTQGSDPIVLNLSRGRTAQDLIRVMDVVSAAKSAAKSDAPVLIATEPVDATGHAVTGASAIAPPK